MNEFYSITLSYDQQSITAGYHKKPGSDTGIWNLDDADFVFIKKKILNMLF